ncbi:hypothetical protein [Nocardiopsis synnemataformans]|uniref:hypothetical protein n=1 Tax=Nocardiopsis synnemataformans TaxID=61305 RepID=UPI003EB82D06
MSTPACPPTTHQAAPTRGQIIRLAEGVRTLAPQLLDQAATHLAQLADQPHPDPGLASEQLRYLGRALSAFSLDPITMPAPAHAAPALNALHEIAPHLGLGSLRAQALACTANTIRRRLTKPAPDTRLISAHLRSVGFLLTYTHLTSIRPDHEEATP